MEERETPPETKPHYRWPWFVLALLLLGLALAVLWMSVVVRRIHAERESTPLPSLHTAPQ